MKASHFLLTILLLGGAAVTRAEVAVPALLPVALVKPAILIVDGRNNHDWRTTTDALRATLENTGLFEVAVTTAPEDKLPSPPREPKGGDAGFAEAKARYADLVKAETPALDAAWAKWSPDFSKYAAVVLNYNGPAWPEPMRKSFVEYVRGGGGVFHAAEQRPRRLSSPTRRPCGQTPRNPRAD